MTRVNKMVLFVLVSFLGACTTSVHIVGNDAIVLKKSEWNGTWVHKDISLWINVKDQIAGKIEIKFIDNNGNLKEFMAFVRNMAESNYINVTSHKEDKKEYAFFKFQKNKNELIAWKPNEDKIKQDIYNNLIKGKVGKHGQGASIMEDSVSVHEYINSNISNMFQYQKPLIFTRLVK